VDWDFFDFAVFGAMLLGVGIVYALAKRRANNTTYRFAFGAALAAAFLLVWVNGAVGIIGNENNDANMMFFGVLVVGVVGAIIARLQPKGMARAMYATAIAQALVAVIALAANLGPAGTSWPWDVLVLTGFFTALWLVSARLFRKAARHPLSDPEFR
jgi:di/tricarboxylate transporter